jgi:hypothetical protein
MSKTTNTYFLLSSRTDEDGMKQSFEFAVWSVGEKKFTYGVRLHPSDHPTAGPREKEPEKVIKLNLKRTQSQAPLPSYLSQPAPLLRKDLLDIIRATGVINLDAYPAKLYYPDDSEAEGEYYIVNIVGFVSAKEADDDDAEKFLMFRLAESEEDIIVHKKVVNAIEKAGIPLIKFYSLKNLYGFATGAN